VVQPTTTDQVAAVLAFAASERLAVVPWGQGTQMHLGGLPQRYDIALSLAGLNRMVEYDSANLTLIAEAGIPLRDVYRTTIPERQFLPLGFPGTAASLGGLAVTNSSGVKRARYGSMRDLLLGVRVALVDGSRVRYGGRVVKNVAGYDMNKLFIGSLGAFGVVLETSYRLAALPEDDRLLAVVFPSRTQALAAAAAVWASQLQPSAITLWSAAACGTTTLPLTVAEEHVALILNCDGLHEAVERQLRDSQAICHEHGATEATCLSGEDVLALWECQERWHHAPDAEAPPCVQLRLSVLRSQIDTALDTVTTLLPCCQRGAGWMTDYVQGQLYLHVSLTASEVESHIAEVRFWLRQLRLYARDWHGACVVEYAPTALRAHLDMWGDLAGAPLLRLYKERFDPHALLNPGRYVAGL
jgi:glycolate oxidase FAD binding subunit